MAVLVVAGLSSCLSGENGGYSSAPVNLVNFGDSTAIDNDFTGLQQAMFFSIENDSLWYSSSRGYYKSFEITGAGIKWTGKPIEDSEVKSGYLQVYDAGEFIKLGDFNKELFQQEGGGYYDLLDFNEEAARVLASQMNNPKISDVPFQGVLDQVVIEGVDEAKKGKFEVVFIVKVTF
ncbi:hypothetical protein PEDI_45250 [Persicobacter diffluens]|uniref:Uncharacterized protein n=2 Tax=Persicobacter diffluens TaxID=981 RepID=A0AAN5APL7_9BACT|nr:hypothetical protein PEDI_45250 [Persicobacter diffluens]